MTESGADTPMGGLMRRYWIPALLSSELPPPDCTPVRVTLLGEDLVAFRDTDGRIGLLDRHCAHRGASLFFGRNEECGLRCVYHGWKYDVDGRCVDMPNEPEPLTGDEASADRNHEASPLGAAPRRFKTKVTITAYPCVERGGVIWTYMGPPELKPGVPELEWSAVPEPQRFHSKRLQECNWLQAMEGGIDSSHISFLHSGTPPLKKERAESIPAYMMTNSPARDRGYHQRDTSPKFETVDTDYGMLIGARREAEADSYYWRITQWLFPWYTMIPPFGDGGIGGHAWVPIDDESCWAWSFTWHPARPLDAEQVEGMRQGQGIHSVFIPGTFRPAANRDNDYLIDREKQLYTSFTGIDGIGTQDCAVQESMGRIYNRAREHLGSSDTAIIAARRRLISALRDVERGIGPPALDPDGYRVRSFSTVLPRDVPWAEGAKEGLVARSDVFIASV